MALSQLLPPLLALFPLAAGFLPLSPSFLPSPSHLSGLGLPRDEDTPSCDPCTVQDCKHCEACQDDKTGACEECWTEGAIYPNFTCISDQASLLAPDCKGCWNVNEDAMPVVLFSGLTASNLQATWKDQPVCADQLEPVAIWPFPVNVSVSDLLCAITALKVEFDDDTKTFHDRKGVNVTVVEGFPGLTYGLLLADYMELYGYRKNHNMFALPFDWRQSSHGDEELFKSVKVLVERAYDVNGHKVMLSAPSYGPQIALAFLQRQTLEWKDKYISWFVASSPVWGGSPTSMLVYSKGFPLLGDNAPPAADLLCRGLATHMPALLWLPPRPGSGPFNYPVNETILMTPSKNYSAYDAKEMLRDAGYPGLVPEFDYLQTTGALATFEAPMVNTYVNYGKDVDTIASFAFKADLQPLVDPNVTAITFSSGDNLVPVRSSLRSTLWADAHKAGNKTLIHAAFSGMQHAACLVPFVDVNHTACFYDVLDLMLNGVQPKPSP